MIKKTIFIFAIALFLAFSVSKPYKDGNYRSASRAKYTNEPYYGQIEIAIENGKIIKIEFSVLDSSKHEYFDDKYEKYFAGNEEYIQQCRNDWKGIQSYPDSLLKYQDINKVDAISGATWSFNIFKASVQEALSTAENASDKR
jgi:major membrane immunogen (membrane-anchored lipoprotein)